MSDLGSGDLNEEPRLEQWNHYEKEKGVCGRKVENQATTTLINHNQNNDY